ncbi:hypothetical protein GF351_02210, partial [Candidatus Woesearchaeota archaeon]|nr:hypothetical protein [Candidatus Woesearchaeota archaeon]
MTDEYDIIPHKEIKALKKEIDELKKGQETSSGKTLQNTIEDMSMNMQKMTEMFKEALGS